MLTEEREKEIRDYWIFEIYTSTAINDLLAEIDRIRAENANMRLDLEWPIVKERDAMKAELEVTVEKYKKLVQENKVLNEEIKSAKHQSRQMAAKAYADLTITLREFESENHLLRERIGKLREAISSYTLLSDKYVINLAKNALTQDDEAAK